MRVYEEMGRLIQERWVKYNHDEEAFPELAARVLQEMAPYKGFDPMAPIEWLFSTRDFPRQLTARSDFGQPPITVFSDHRLVIDLYYWLDGTTDIHQHGFSGAFQVVKGGSIHGQYRWNERHRVNGRMAFGDLSLESLNELKEGDVQQIPPGNRYIHSLFHLERPSVTCVVRTLHTPNAGVQYSYKKPFLAIDSTYEDVQTNRILQSLTFLRDSPHAVRKRLLSELIERSDIHTCYLLFKRLLEIYKEETALEEFWEVAIRRHGALAEQLLPVFQERIRQSMLVSRRAQVKTEEHRYFLALLLNIDDAESLLGLVRQRYPHEDPREKVMRWVEELSKPTDGVGSGDTLGIPLDETALIIFRELLHGHSEAGVMGRLKEVYGADETEREAASIAEMVSALRASPVFRPLFAR
ncbi:hypothetical protein EJ065_3147 [Corallococcus coralloides]|uniref:Uncharacterized protein n=1 Tax=Corallococcus coralloides TaxID=184914 RepID=A0A410RS25_CORCK|nr:hypothetical protein [Corallococcus coralloides]QAT84714.1 hypothetical protein EJ065_3147 [Corallococcus coralloides]